MGKIGKAAAALLGLLAISEAGSSAYFYRRTMKRNKAKVERTMKNGRVRTGPSICR